ncbi:MAG: NAD-dependent epimerase/dehydratase family protein [Acidobacteria bacterium]|nr:MAG: NAD-dependent epimerase/dehydratase family protein [Acidobacteriota bacterium]
MRARSRTAQARIASERNCTLIHFSSDFVFDGVAPGPYDESTPPHPRGAYASSKLIGEWFASEVPRHYLLRVESLFGGPVAKSTIDGMYAAFAANREVRAFSDRTVSPSYVGDVAAAAIALATGTTPFGLYHCVNSGHTTWLGVARELARLMGRRESLITPVTFAGVAMKVPRPQHAALSNEKLKRAGIVMPTWQDALARYVANRSAT